MVGGTRVILLLKLDNLKFFEDKKLKEVIKNTRNLSISIFSSRLKKTTKKDKEGKEEEP